MPQPVRIFIADDHQVLVDGLISFFEKTKHIEVAGAANDGRTLLETLPQADPDIVLLDLNMPGMDGVAALEQIVRRFPKVKVIILSNYHQSGLIKSCAQKGAWGYLLKNGSMDDLMAAIDGVMAGKRQFAAGEEEERVEKPHFLDDSFLQQYSLTNREVDIIRSICQELSSKEIASQLFISEFTVNTHRRNIMRKLNVRNAAGIINFAAQHKLV
ncbi:response regulator [Flaviaesturariibacter aridisoli]|uniref:Response regulator transcription factor n=1 Tax=Flaviaesturariibacter aridisoli TaxID=2545761 RepID=A0A4R4E135_9BACT|nr:response regulator transcription factor [Flaviaesturariibacter aridisoli]TCZ73154.1 response regulator transcription factor [Flaviaesturariibacter aridisoli]